MVCGHVPGADVFEFCGDFVECGHVLEFVPQLLFKRDVSEKHLAYNVVELHYAVFFEEHPHHIIFGEPVAVCAYAFKTLGDFLFRFGREFRVLLEEVHIIEIYAGHAALHGIGPHRPPERAVKLPAETCDRVGHPPLQVAHEQNRHNDPPACFPVCAVKLLPEHGFGAERRYKNKVRDNLFLYKLPRFADPLDGLAVECGKVDISKRADD